MANLPIFSLEGEEYIYYNAESRKKGGTVAAPRNEEQRNAIYNAAIALFSLYGFKGATYSDIADACSVTKSVVQHYFPKKELFVEMYFDRHMEDLQQRAGLSVEDDPLRAFCAMGLLHFHYLLSDAKMRRFNEDIVASRELTSVMVEREREWATGHLPSEDADELADIITAALGGAYELVFQGWRGGRHLEAEAVERVALVPLAVYLGKTREQVEEIIGDCMAAVGQRL